MIAPNSSMKARRGAGNGKYHDIHNRQWAIVFGSGAIILVPVPVPVLVQKPEVLKVRVDRDLGEYLAECKDREG